MELNLTRIEDSIVSEVTDKMVSDDELYDRVRKAVSANVEARIHKHFREVADQQIRSAIEAAITDGFEREYQKVDNFGTGVGPKTTIRKELERHIGGYWNEAVDKYGKPTTAYGEKLTRAEWMMTKLVAADFHGDMQQHVINLGGLLKDKLRAELHGTVNKLLSEVFYVKSAEDQQLGSPGKSIIHPPQKPAAP